MCKKPIYQNQKYFLNQAQNIQTIMGETDKYKYLKLNLQFLFIKKMQKKKV